MGYAFMLNMWIMRKVDEDFLRGQAKRGRITDEEVEMILLTPQNEQQ